jgi:predicted HD phosphohydrolase
VQLRRWDDLAKVPGHATPSLDYYLALLQDLATEASSSEGVPLAAA